MQKVCTQSSIGSSRKRFVRSLRRLNSKSSTFKRQQNRDPPLSLHVVALSVVIVLFCATHKLNALRMINLDAPRAAFQGDTIKLSCFFSLQTRNATRPSPVGLSTSTNLPIQSAVSLTSMAEADEQLYAIKWYKNEREFFRYLASDWPRKQALPMEGISVDVERSDNYTVVLRSVSLKTSGLFRCEVSTDAPYFITKSIEQKVHIYSLPKNGPKLELLTKPTKEREYSLGDRVELLCTSPESKPHATFDWIINNNINLSALNSASLRLLFESKEQRFIRLPNSMFNSNNAQVNKPSSAHYFLPNVAKQTPKMSNVASLSASATTNSSASTPKDHNVNPPKLPITYATYELLNGTTIQAVSNAVSTDKANSQASGANPLINLHPNLIGLLDHLTELSTSRLSFIVDANLLQFLASGGSTSQAAIGGSPKNTQSGRHTAYAIKPHETGVWRSELRSEREIMNKSTLAILARNLSFVNITHIDTSSALKSSLNDNVPKKKVQQRDIRHLPTTSQSFSSSISTKLMKIRCISRVFHQLMYDELRLKILDSSSMIRAASVSDRSKRLNNLVPKNSGVATYVPRISLNTMLLSNALINSLITKLILVPSI